MVQGKENALVDLLTVQVNHLVNDLVPAVQVLKDLLFGLLLLGLVLVMQSLDVVDVLHDGAFGASSVSEEKIELGRVYLFLDSLKWFQSEFFVFFGNRTRLIVYL